MKKYCKEQQEYIYVSRYQMLSKILIDVGYLGTIIGFDSNKDMYRCKIHLDNNKHTLVWYTDEEVQNYYHAYRDKKRKKKENHERYIKSKKLNKVNRKVDDSN